MSKPIDMSVEKMLDFVFPEWPGDMDRCDSCPHDQIDCGPETEAKDWPCIKTKRAILALIQEYKKWANEAALALAEPRPFDWINRLQKLASDIIGHAIRFDFDKAKS
jgi:hypothetical protein